MDKQVHYQTADPFLYDILKEFAKKNRKFQTEEELILWKYLSNNKLGLHFRRQHIIYDYIADFVCIKKMLVIEVDGGYHSQYEQMVMDEHRTLHLNRLGYKVLRIKNEEIHEDLSNVLDIIFNNIAK